MSYTLRLCYDGGRHRWLARNRITHEPIRGIPAYYQQWCERCGNWKDQVQIYPAPSSKKATP